MKIISFNVKHFMHDSRQLPEVAALLKEKGADLVGLQEVDDGCTRSGQVRQAAECAKLAGFPYFAFGKNIDHQGGEYGNAILSKYPIVSAETVSYQVKAPTDHNRSYMRVGVEVDGKTVYFYNTHLTLQKNGEATEEVKELCARMQQDEYAIAVGDFNLYADIVAEIAEPEILALNGGAGRQTLNTFSTNNPIRPIDNILITPNMVVAEEAQTHHGTLSDHNPLWATIDVPERAE